MGNHVVQLRANRVGCGTVEIDSAVVLVNALPDSTLIVSSENICEGAPNAFVRISPSQSRVKYQLFKSNVAIGSPVVGNGGVINIRFPSTMLSSGYNTISAKAYLEGCSVVNLRDTTNIIVYARPSVDFQLFGDTLCENDDSAEVTINNTSPSVRYRIKTTKIDTLVSGVRNVLKVKIPVAKLAVGNNEVSISAIVAGGYCPDIILTQTTSVMVHSIPVFDFNVIGDTVEMEDKSAEIRISNVEAGTYFNIFGSEIVDTTWTTTTTGSYLVKISLEKDIEPGRHEINIRGSMVGCTTKYLSKVAYITVNSSILSIKENKTTPNSTYVWPNPFISEINLVGFKMETTIKLLNNQGISIYETVLTSDKQNIIYPNVKPGLYFLEYERAGEKGVIKLFK